VKISGDQESKNGCKEIAFVLKSAEKLIEKTKERKRGRYGSEVYRGSREQGAGSREQGAGSREQGAGSREQGINMRRYNCVTKEASVIDDQIHLSQA
jgi:hypothetical protein